MIACLYFIHQASCCSSVNGDRIPCGLLINLMYILNLCDFGILSYFYASLMPLFKSVKVC